MIHWPFAVVTTQAVFIASVDPSIISAAIAGVFLLVNTCVTLYVTDKRWRRDRSDDLERRRTKKRRPENGRGPPSGGTGGEKPGTDHSDA